MKSIECMLCKYNPNCSVKHQRYKKKYYSSIGGYLVYHCKKKDDKVRIMRNQFIY